MFSLIGILKLTRSGHYDNHGSAGPTKSKRWKIVIGARISLPINLSVLTVLSHYADAYDADSGAEPKPGRMTHPFMKTEAGSLPMTVLGRWK